MQSPHSNSMQQQVPEKGKFLKGLAVVDDIAYFGISVRLFSEILFICLNLNNISQWMNNT